jgi:hypothetical protein
VNSSVGIPNYSAAKLYTTGNLTIMAWINPATTTGYRAIINQAQDSYSFWFGGNQLQLRRYDISSLTLSVPGPPINQWSYVVAVMESNQRTKIYVNGAEVGSKTFGSGSVYNSPQIICIGAEVCGVQNFFQGLIDEVRIYNRALSPDEIKALYEATR